MTLADLYEEGFNEIQAELMLKKYTERLAFAKQRIKKELKEEIKSNEHNEETPKQEIYFFGEATENKSNGAQKWMVT